MKNREIIKKLRDYAELAWAAYGYFDLIGQKFHSKSESRKEEAITLIDILDIRYKHYKAGKKIQIGQNQIEESIGTLKGDFSPTQAKNFFERYDLLEHCPNTDSGFSATLFKDLGEFDEKTNTRKAVDKDSQYILSFRGTEFKLNFKHKVA